MHTPTQIRTREVWYDHETGLHISYAYEPSPVPQWYAEMIDPDYHKACVQARSELLSMTRRP